MIQVNTQFKFDIHLELMVSYQGLQSGLPMFVVGEFGTFQTFPKINDCLIRFDFSYFSNSKHPK